MCVSNTSLCSALSILYIVVVVGGGSGMIMKSGRKFCFGEVFFLVSLFFVCRRKHIMWFGFFVCNVQISVRIMFDTNWKHNTRTHRDYIENNT